jgi:dipeptidyl aminopeptidase/acylaminoacyl peptidase
MVTRAGVGLVVGLVAGGLLLGCATSRRVDLDLLPDSPLALLRRPEADALRRLDAIADLEAARTGAATSREGVATVDRLRSMLGGGEDFDPRLLQSRGHLVLLDPRTGDVERIAGAPPQARPAAWSPDRRRLLLSGNWRDRRQLFIWDRESDRFEIVTGGPVHHVNGCITAEDRLVAVQVESAALQQAPSRLVASGPGGSVLEPITESGFHFAMGCSAARPQIVFVRVSPDDARPRLLVLDLDPLGEPVEIGTGAAPVFTPDGEWIVYVGITADGARLVRVRPDGTGRTRLGAGVHEEGSPAVSPDGDYVAYIVEDRDRRERVWVRRMDGTGERPLMTDGDGAVPVW